MGTKMKRMTSRAKCAFRIAYETLKVIKQIQEDFHEPYSAWMELEKALEKIEKLMTKEDWDNLYKRKESKK
jgi:prephenate dehydrogenase